LSRADSGICLDERGTQQSDETQSASGAIAAYMHQNGVHDTDPNQIYQWAINRDGDVPPQVQKGARFMLAHPDIFDQISNHDGPGANGKTCVNNFDAAAEGEIPGLEGSSGKPGGAEGMESMPPARASGVLAGFLHSRGIEKIDVNGLSDLARDKGGDVPENVQQAAASMLARPKAWERIETLDDPHADGLSSVRNLDIAAQGRVPGVGCGEHAGSVRTAPSHSARGAEGGGEMMSPGEASGAVAGFMRQMGMDKMDPKGLYLISTDPNAPPHVRDAAASLLAQPQAWKRIETLDDPNSDGKSGLQNLDMAAQGRVPGLDGRERSGSVPPNSAYSAHGAEGSGERMPPAEASGAVAGFMRQMGMDKMDPKGLYLISTDPNAPPHVRDAAASLLAQPQAWKRIETLDDPRSDGLSSLQNLDRAATGEVPGLQDERA
jgi:tellurite resistance-related uncharacterized protein